MEAHGSRRFKLFGNEAHQPQVVVVQVPVTTEPPRPLPTTASIALPSEEMQPTVSTATPADTIPKTEEQIQRERAEAIYRPRMEAAADFVRSLRTLSRRYGDACTQQTVTTKTGVENGVSVGTTQGTGSSQGSTTFTDRSGRTVGYGDSAGTSTYSGTTITSMRRDWNEIATTDNATTPECRLIASDIRDLSPRVYAFMDEAEQEAVKQNIWTWMQRDVPDRLASVVWANR
jgi:hypothetical protein